MFVRNCWYVVAWDDEVRGEALLERTVLGESLLIYRRVDGRPVVLNNRCPHRHAPLSMGRREGDHVRCMYPGLKFSPDGRCVEVPAQPRIQESLCTASYPVAEKGAWIWVWMGDPALADETLVPAAYSLRDPDWRYKPGGYLRYDADYLSISDNLLDFSHLSYVHEKTLGASPNIAEVRPSIEKIDRGLRITRDVIGTAPTDYHMAFGGFAGKVDRRFVYEFLVPGILLLSSHVKETGKPADDMEGALRFHSCQALTPETDSTTHYFFMAAHAFRLDDPTISEALHQSLVAAFEEDRHIITAQQRLIRSAPPKPMQPIAADAALGQFRHLVRTMAEAENVQQ